MSTKSTKPKTPAKRKAPAKAAPRKSAPKKPGRPSVYSEKLAAALCALLAEGMSLRTICKREDMPSMTTVMRWLGEEDKAAFREQYARAREAQADYLAEEILEIADLGINDTYTDEDGKVRVDHDVIARSRLRVDARKWLASKMAPKKYGDKITAEHTGPGGGAIQVESTVRFVMPPEYPEDEE